MGYSVSDLALAVHNNEALDVGIRVMSRDPGEAVIPLDLTGAELQCQVRQPPARPEYPGFGQLILTLTVDIEDAPEGRIRLSATAAQMATVAPGNYVYDVLYKPSALAGQESLWKAPFRVERGVTEWTP